MILSFITIANILIGLWAIAVSALIVLAINYKTK